VDRARTSARRVVRRFFRQARLSTSHEVLFPLTQANRVALRMDAISYAIPLRPSSWPLRFFAFVTGPPIQRRNTQSSGRGIIRRGLRYRRQASSALHTTWSGLLQGPDSVYGIQPFAALLSRRGCDGVIRHPQPTCRFSNDPDARPVYCRWPSSQFAVFLKGRRRVICRGSWVFPLAGRPAGF